MNLPENVYYYCEEKFLIGIRAFVCFYKTQVFGRLQTFQIVVAVPQNNHIVNVYFSCKEKYELFILKYSYVSYLYCYLYYLVKITNVIKVILF